MVTTPDAPQAVNGQHSELLSATKIGRGRPRAEPTERITVRLPVKVLDVVRRRAEKASMEPSVWLARVIHHEAFRSHHKRK